MRFLLNERYSLCGYLRLPFALYDRESGRTNFFDRGQFELLFSCSGKKEIDPQTLSDAQRSFLETLQREGIIREAQNGETRDLTYKEYKNIYKHDVQWSVTGACNYRCKHCFQSAAYGLLGSPSTEECLDIVRQLDECGIRNVAVTGGEALIRPDLFDIFDEMTRRGIHLTTIYSNGKLITPALLDALEARGLHPAFQLSFDGVGFHDWMRGVDGAEQIALNAFRLLRERGNPASAAMCLCRENLGSIRETVQTLAEVGCTSLKFQRTMPQGEWKNQPEHFLSYEETLQAYLDYLPQYKADGCPLDIQMEGFFAYTADAGWHLPCRRGAKNEQALGKLPPCGVIHTSLYIGPNGAVVPCMSMCGGAIEKQFPNLHDTPLCDILTASSYTELTSKRVAYLQSTKPECVRCERKLDCCGGCRAFAVGDGGEDYFAIDPVTCLILKEGWDYKAEALARELFPLQDNSEQEARC